MARNPKLLKTFNQRTGYDRNDGLPGVVYILHNEAMRDGVYKIGQSTRSGHARANDLNRTVGTETPKMFKCIFEVSTRDCGRAEKAVHFRLRSHRMTKQEYFDVELEFAKEIIIEECKKWEAIRAIQTVPAPTLSKTIAVSPPLTVPGPATSTTWVSSNSYWTYLFWIVAVVCLVSLWPSKVKTPRITSHEIQNKGSPTQQDSYTPSGSPQIETTSRPVVSSKATQSFNINSPIAGSTIPRPSDPLNITRENLLERLNNLTREEKSSLEMACSTDKFRNGPAAYNKCRERQLASLQAGAPAPNLDGLTREEKSSLESACSTDKYRNGPAAYNKCRTRQLADMRR